ncbi:MAG: ATP-grasp domain-containing protein [Thermoplasmatota archaeon]
MTAIIFTPVPDPHSQRIIDALASEGVRCGRFNLADPSTNGFTLAIEGGKPTGTVRTAEGSFDIAEIDTFYGHFLSLRPPPTDERARQFAVEEWMSALMCLYMTTRDRQWINPFEVQLFGEAKAFQANVAAQAGLATPDSITSNEAGAIEAFASAHDDAMALKRVGHPFPQIVGGEPARFVLYTNKVRGSDFRGQGLEGAHIAPVHLEDYIEKDVEIRAYVIGDRVFAAEILSQNLEMTKDDWRRYPFRQEGDKSVVDTTQWVCRPHALPEHVATALRRTARGMGMVYAAMDLIKTPQGQYVFLEANSAGAFGFAEQQAGLPISEALAALACNPRRWPALPP